MCTHSERESVGEILKTSQMQEKAPPLSSPILLQTGKTKCDDSFIADESVRFSVPFPAGQETLVQQTALTAACD